ncbi:hypothetical protein V461_05070 [Pantoea ananatis BRT98]|nr:hypothetical protein V461_05070 [Pantoea ananatis BRT98]
MKQKMNTNGADAFMTPEAIRKLVLTQRLKRGSGPAFPSR